MADKPPARPPAATSPAIPGSPGLWEAVSIDTDTTGEAPPQPGAQEDRALPPSSRPIQSSNQRLTFYFQPQLPGHRRETERCAEQSDLCNYSLSTILLTIKMKTCKVFRSPHPSFF